MICVQVSCCVECAAVLAMYASLGWGVREHNVIVKCAKCECKRMVGTSWTRARTQIVKLSTITLVHQWCGFLFSCHSLFLLSPSLAHVSICRKASINWWNVWSWMKTVISKEIKKKIHEHIQCMLPSQNRWKYWAFQILFSPETFVIYFHFQSSQYVLFRNFGIFFTERCQKKHMHFHRAKKIDDFHLIVQHKNSFPIHIYKMTGHLLRELFACEAKKEQWQRRTG